MPLLLVVLTLALLAPLLVRGVAALLGTYLLAIVLFLPAGALLRIGPGADPVVYFGTTALWSMLLLLASVARRRRASAPGGTAASGVRRPQQRARRAPVPQAGGRIA